MIRYFQLSKVKEIYGQCPLYGTCQTGKALLPETCIKYKCNTFYQVDTIQLFLDSPWGPNAGSKASKDEEKNKASGIVKIVKQHFNRSSNGNGHSNGNGKSSKISPISVSFS